MATKAFMVVFENDFERYEMCARAGHDYEHEPKIFGKETDKMLKLCKELCLVSLYIMEGDTKKLQRKIYGIAKYHGVYIKWHGDGRGGVNQPDRFTVSGRGHERLACIQC